MRLMRPLKPCLVKYFKWLLIVMKVQRAGKGHILVLDQTTKGTLEAQRASKNTGEFTNGNCSPQAVCRLLAEQRVYMHMVVFNTPFSVPCLNSTSFYD